MIFKTFPTMDKWIKEHKEKCENKNPDNAQFKYSFTPIEMEEIQEVLCLICGEKYIEHVD